MASIPRLTILIVEDESLIGLDVQESFEAAGFGTEFVACPLEAAVLLGAEDADFAGLVTDIRLRSTMSGWDLALIARERQGDFPIVYVSGDSAHEHRTFGVSDSVMVQKPFASSQIVSVMSALLGALPEISPDGSIKTNS